MGGRKNFQGLFETIQGKVANATSGRPCIGELVRKKEKVFIENEKKVPQKRVVREKRRGPEARAGEVRWLEYEKGRNQDSEKGISKGL